MRKGKADHLQRIVPEVMAPCPRASNHLAGIRLDDLDPKPARAPALGHLDQHAQFPMQQGKGRLIHGVDRMHHVHQGSAPRVVGARTVAHLDVYFEELRLKALDLKRQVAARERGYFTPSEDELARQLLISYWQSRCALFDLVNTYRHDSQLTAELRPSAFLVAYAGAVLLVHAARFLRETFGDSPVVIAKLNEPEPHFGIPGGVYERVQHSLTSPKHAWHLYHAFQYFLANEGQLRELAQDPVLAPCLAVIDRLQQRLHVNQAQYATARLRVRLDQARRGLRQDLLGRAIYGLVKLAGCTTSEISTRPGHKPDLPLSVREQLRPLLRPGDVFITRKEHAMTNYFLPGFWPHAALYLGEAQALVQLGMSEHEHVRPRWEQLLAADPHEPRRVLEALKDGVRIRSVDSPLCSDAVLVLRPRLAPSDIAQALCRGFFHEGKPYDFDFDFSRSDRLVCTEIVYRSFEGVGGMRFQLVRRAGRLTLAAEDLIQMALDRQGFEPLAVYVPGHTPSLCAGGDVDPVVRATSPRFAAVAAIP